MRSWSFSKGHGTLNDFVIIADRHGMLNPSDDDVRLLCDRRAGIGGDGLLRAIKATHIPEWDGDPDLWFMDYRNADGSIAEMCGNGLRVFARYLLDEGLIGGSELPIATRSGLRQVTVHGDNLFAVDMGQVIIRDVDVLVGINGHSAEAVAVDVGNPHAVVIVPDLANLDLTEAPTWTPVDAFAAGVNIEFVRVLSDSHLQLRVHERGVGETRSCGTGTVAAAAAVAQSTGRFGGSEPVRTQVEMPGGSVDVELIGDRATLTGPAVIVCRGEVSIPNRVRVEA